MNTYSTIFQSMSTTHLYSDLFGAEVRTSGGGRAPAEGFYVLSYKPFLLQVQEQGKDGVWRMIYCAEFPRKRDALAAAERQGIALDHVDHRKDAVRGVVLGRSFSS